MTTKEAGYFNLKKFLLTPYLQGQAIDIKLLIHSFEITESMNTGSIRGSAKIFDSNNILYNLPLRGEEFVDIEYEDFFQNVHTDKMFIYSITNVRAPRKGAQDQWEYTIHFVSRPKIYSENYRLQRAYGGPAENRAQGGRISDFARSVYDEFYGIQIDSRFKNDSKSKKHKNIIIQETFGNQRLVVPKYTPEQTMHFFARRAYSQESFSQTFKFFENRKTYAFGTDEFTSKVISGGGNVGFGTGLVDPGLARAAGISNQTTVPIFYEDYLGSYTPDDQERLQRTIVSAEYESLVNTIDDLENGAFNRNVYEINTLYNVVNANPYNFKDGFSSNNPGLKLLHSDQFINERMTREKDRWVVKDYSTEGAPSGPAVRPNTYYPNIYNQKYSHRYHANSNKFIVTIHGDNNIVAGGLIDLKFFRHDLTVNNIINDEQRSGRFLIERIDNIFIEDNYKQRLTLTRYGIGNKNV
jgi:hypothetical protein